MGKIYSRTILNFDFCDKLLRTVLCAVQHIGIRGTFYLQCKKKLLLWSRSFYYRLLSSCLVNNVGSFVGISYTTITSCKKWSFILTGKGVNIFKNIYPCSVLQGRAKEELHFTIPSTQYTTTCMVNFQPLNSGRTMQFSVLCSSLYYDPLSVALKGAPKMFIMGGCLKVNTLLYRNTKFHTTISNTLLFTFFPVL